MISTSHARNEHSDMMFRSYGHSLSATNLDFMCSVTDQIREKRGCGFQKSGAKNKFEVNRLKTKKHKEIMPQISRLENGLELNNIPNQENIKRYYKQLITY
jgi:hypothetical protein